jgi:enamine deaminase RidA (YjgF/YER057c/UK114 family)
MNTFVTVPNIEDFYAATLTPDIPEYQGTRIAHAVVSTGRKTLRMSGFPAIGPHGIIGRGDMRVQTEQALDYTRQAVEAAGATWDDVIHVLFYFTNRDAFHRHAVPVRKAFFERHSNRKQTPCITAVGVSCLMHPDMLVEVEVTAVWD